MEVPTVTNDDLFAFHARTFGSSAPQSSALIGTILKATQQQHVTQTLHQTAGADEEDDGLGYYPDGVKRTLTDEQVAMFRHSEIYAILRARQVARENGDDDSEESRVVVEGPEMDKEREDNVYGDKVEKMPLNGSVGSTEDIPEYLGNEALDPTSHVENEQESRHHPRQLPPRGEQRKRRRHEIEGYNDATSINSKIRSRGRVRELDASFAEEQVLDYGDEAPSESNNTQQQREAVEQPKVEGRKIWWPVLGGE